ncbi:MAG TPA: FAD-dependent oxidoreductase, partial [Myxococcaceae bacterium]|nr:FAD-dependent oxidoreductase [Myxococcaceae bacterium]
MIDVSELATVPVLSGAPGEDLVRVARTAADIRLAPGEYAAHEGDDRALFLVLAGKIEVTKAIDGIERCIGWRAPGQIFGEVPIIFGISFQGSFRAHEPSRVIRIDPAQFHTLAAHFPDALTRVAALARERIGGLQGIAAAPVRSRATLLGHRGDPACRELHSFLTRNQIRFEWLNPDSADPSRWPGLPAGPEDLPALHSEDGTTLLRARPRQVAERLGLSTLPRESEYDTIVLGGGPAGLAAAVYGASEGLRTLVIEREAPGGQAETSSRIENYLGFPTGVSGDELARRALQQAKRLGAEIIVTRPVTAIEPGTGTVHLEGHGAIHARTMIIATGVSWRRLAIDGFDRLLGKGVYYGASRSEASMTQDQDIHLIGAGNSAGQAAMFFANHARTVTLLVRGSSLEKGMSHYLVGQLRGKSNIRVALSCEVQAIHGREQLEAIDIVDRTTGGTRREPSTGVFVFIGADAETSWLPAELARDERGYLLTGDAVVKAGRWRERRDPYLLETSVPGIFACGDVRSSPVKRVAAAVGEGSMAIAFVH